MRSSQRGQALVGVLAVMIILFALAGAVAIGASTLLLGGRSSGSVASDFQVRSAVNDSVAQLAGYPQRCVAPPPSPSPSPTPTPTSRPTPLQLTLPGGIATQALCEREDSVVPGSLKPNPVPASQSICNVVDLGVPGAGRLAVLFDARMNGGIRQNGQAWAYIDTNSGSPLNCSSSLPRFHPNPPSEQFIPSRPPGTLVQVALSGNFNAGDHVYLHISNFQAPSLPRVFTARQDPTAAPSAVGSLYLVAAATKLSSPSTEELILFVASDGSRNQLLYEAPLP